MRSLLLLPAVLTATPSLAADAPVRRVQYVMGTLCGITAYGPNAEAAETEAFAEIARLDRALSLYKRESDLSRLNAAAGTWFAASPALWEAVTEAVKYSSASGGAFDPTILPALKDGPGALGLVGYGKVETNIQTHAVRLGEPGMGLDFGGIGKGIALDHAARTLRERGVVSALIDFGGQLMAVGAPPGAAAWPARIDGVPGTFYLKDASLSTSGNAERPGHIASPFTGEKILETYSVSVVAPSAAEADAWSTALFVRGPGGASAAGYDGCFVFSGARPVQASACSRYLGHD